MVPALEALYRAGQCGYEGYLLATLATLDSVRYREFLLELSAPNESARNRADAINRLSNVYKTDDPRLIKVMKLALTDPNATLRDEAFHWLTTVLQPPAGVHLDSGLRQALLAILRIYLKSVVSYSAIDYQLKDLILIGDKETLLAARVLLLNQEWLTDKESRLRQLDAVINNIPAQQAE